MQKEREKERKQKEDYSEFLRQQIEEKRKRKEIEKQKEKEYDLKLERQYQEYLKKQKDIENNSNNSTNYFEQNTLKRPISNRGKTINDIFNENNINTNIINSIQNSQQNLNNEAIKSRTNYKNFNSDDINEELKTRNKRSTASSSFLNSGKGIMDSFNSQIKIIDELPVNLNTNNNEIPSNNNQNKVQNNNINNIKEDKFGFTFKNKVETEEMIDKIIKEADDYLKETLQQSFITKEEKEMLLYKKLNNGQNPKKIIEFQGAFGTNKVNPNLDKTAQFNTKENKINKNNNIEKTEKNKIMEELNNKNIEKNIIKKDIIKENKKDEIKKEDKNKILNIDELLKGIDLKALNYRSKYEEKEEDKKENKDSIKNKENNEELNKDMEQSMKSNSKLVSSKANNETWKKENFEDDTNNDKNSKNNVIEKTEDKKESNKNEDTEEKEDNKKNNKEEIENKKKIMNFLSNRKKDKKIKYKLGVSNLTPKNLEENLNMETKQQAINSSIKLNGSLNPNLKITFGIGGNILSNESIKFNPEKTKNGSLSKFTFGQNLENVIKNNTSIQNINENDKEDNNVEESFDDEEKYDIKVNNENDINYDNMLNKKDDIKFLDFDNFLDISKINKNQNDIEDLCNIRYTTEEEQQQNKKVNEALKYACDSSDEEGLNKIKEQNTYVQDIVNFCGENTIGLKNNNFTNDQNNNENILNKTSSEKNGEKYLELKDSNDKELYNNQNNIISFCISFQYFIA